MNVLMITSEFEPYVIGGLGVFGLVVLEAMAHRVPVIASNTVGSEMNKSIRVLFVCLGNICRSPLAEAVFRRMVRDRGWGESFSIGSAAIADYHIGKGADARARKTALSHGVSLEEHRVRQLTAEDLREWDYIVTMDLKNVGSIMKSGRPSGSLLLLRWFEPQSHRFRFEVPDPYHKTQEAFEEVFKIIERSCQGLLDYIAGQHNL